MPARAGADVAPSVAPGNPRLGVMLPPTPFHHLLLEAFPRPVVATTAASFSARGAFRAFGTGSASTSPYRRAAQSSESGHSPQRARLGVQTVAPSSINAWARIRGRP